MKPRWSLPLAALFLVLGLLPVSAQPVRELQTPTPTTRQALQEALSSLAGEYASAGFHAAVVTQYGRVEPYRQIREASRRGSRTLERLCRKYRVPIPKNSYTKVKAPGSLKAAAVAGIELAEQSLAMYDRFLPLVTDAPELVQTFGRLQFQKREQLSWLQEAAENGGLLPDRRPPRGR